MNYWAIQWVSENRLDGRREFWINDGWKADGRLGPRLFKTRDEARAYRDLHFGYIRNRPDLQAEPHGWKLPRVRKVCIEVTPV